MNGFATFSARLRSASGLGLMTIVARTTSMRNSPSGVGRRDAHLEAPAVHPDIFDPRPFERSLVVAGRKRERGERGRADGLADVFHLNRGSSSSLPGKT
jgi:hypothetical protein